MLHRLKYAAAAAVIALGAGAATDARADVYGFSQSTFSDVTLSFAGGDVVDVTDFSYLSFTDTTQVSGFLDPGGAYVSPPASDTFQWNGTEVTNTLLQNTLSASECIGNCVALDEDYSRASATLSGALVSGVGRDVGVTSTVIGESRVDGTTVGRASSTNTSQGGLTFELEVGGEGTVDLVLSLDFFIDLFLAHEEDNGIQDASASASFSVTVTPFGGGAPLIIAPAELNRGIALSTEFSTASFTDSGSALVPVTLNRGTRYDFVIAHTSTVVVTPDITEVPEPGTVGMLGAGLALLGLGAVRRRRGDKAA